MVALLLGCSNAPSHELHAKSLTLPAKEAAPLCADIEDTELRADCSWRVVEELAHDDYDLCAGLCQALPGAMGHECWFLLGENGDEPAACANAGAMADDCRMHLVGRRLMRVSGDFGADEGPVEEVIVALGLSIQDDRPWSAWYRGLHGRAMPLDRSRCDVVADPWRRDICSMSAIPLFHDRLNMARDRGLELCDSVPDEAAYVGPDAVLDQVLAERRGADLCP